MLYLNYMYLLVFNLIFLLAGHLHEGSSPFISELLEVDSAFEAGRTVENIAYLLYLGGNINTVLLCKRFQGDFPLLFNSEISR